MINHESPEPFILVDRSDPAFAALFRDRKPGILLLDGSSTGLSDALAAGGFDVYRTTRRESAADLARSHPSIGMALVRVRPDPEGTGSLIRALREARPGLWIGMIADPADAAAVAAGYAAGARDLFRASAPLEETIDRLSRTAPRAFAAADAPERRRRAKSPVRRALRKGSRALSIAALALVSLLLGAGLAVGLRSFGAARDDWEGRVDRALTLLEGAAQPRDRADRQFDRWVRFEQMNLQRRTQEELLRLQREQQEDGRIRDLLLRNAGPTYPAR